MELTSVAEASRRLGLTEDTVKRRLRKGELSGQRKPRPQGYVWLVELPEEETVDPGDTLTDTRSTAGGDPDDTRSTPGDDPVSHTVNDREVHRLEEMVNLLQAQVESQGEQLEDRTREVQELHVLLQQSQAALSGPSQYRSWWRRVLGRG